MKAVDPTMFDTELEQWLESLPLTSFVAGGKLPPPGEVLCRPGYNNNDVRLQRDLFLAVSGTVSTTLDTVRLSIRAPPSLFLSAHRPMLSIWLPIINWGYVRPWTVMEALQHAARSLLRPYDPTETLCRQIIAKIFVNSQVQQLRRLMDAMPIATWDLDATPIPNLTVCSLRWSSDWDSAYVGQQGQVFHHRAPGTNREVFTFEIQYPARFVFKYTLDADDEHLDPNQLRELMKDMVYIN